MIKIPHLQINKSKFENLNDQFGIDKMSVGWPWRLMFFSVFIFIFSLFIYFGLRFGYNNFLDDNLIVLEENISQLSSEVTEEDQERFINFYSQLVNLKTVLEEHPFGSNVFNFLEKNTVITVSFDQANVSITERTLSLSGQTDSIKTLAQQLAVFEQSPEVERAVLRNISLDIGRVGFNFTLTFKPDFLINNKTL